VAIDSVGHAIPPQLQVVCVLLAREAIEAWNAAISRPLHAAGCGCCGGRPIRLDPRWLAEDIISALRTRYDAAGSRSLTALLDANLLAADEDFASRLGNLARREDCEQDAGATRILRDVIEMLRSIGKPSPSLR